MSDNDVSQGYSYDELKANGFTPGGDDDNAGQSQAPSDAPATQGYSLEELQNNGFTPGPAQQQPQSQGYSFAELQANGFQPGGAPKPEGQVGTALREAAHAAIPTAASIAPMMAGGEAGFAAGTALAPLAGPFAPAAPFAGALIGGALGGIAGAFAGETVQDVAQSAVGYDDAEQRRINAQANPTSAMVGSLAPAAATFSIGDITDRIAQRLLVGGGMAGVDLIQQEARGGDINLTEAAGAGIAGAVLDRPRAAFEGVANTGAKIGRELGTNIPGVEAGRDFLNAKYPPGRPDLFDGASSYNDKAAATPYRSGMPNAAGRAEDAAPPAKPADINSIGQQGLQPTITGEGQNQSKATNPRSPLGVLSQEEAVAKPSNIDVINQPHEDKDIAAAIESQTGAPAREAGTDLLPEGGTNMATTPSGRPNVTETTPPDVVAAEQQRVANAPPYTPKTAEAVATSKAAELPPQPAAEYPPANTGAYKVNPVLASDLASLGMAPRPPRAQPLKQTTEKALSILRTNGQNKIATALERMPAGPERDAMAARAAAAAVSQTGKVPENLKNVRVRTPDTLKNLEVPGYNNPETGKPYRTRTKEMAQLFGRVHDVNKSIFNDERFQPKPDETPEQTRTRAKAMLAEAAKQIDRNGQLPIDVYKMNGLNKPREWAMLREARNLARAAVKPDEFLANERLIRGSPEGYQAYAQANKDAANLARGKGPTIEATEAAIAAGTREQRPEVAPSETESAEDRIDRLNAEAREDQGTENPLAEFEQSYKQWLDKNGGDNPSAVDRLMRSYITDHPDSLDLKGGFNAIRQLAMKDIPHPAQQQQGKAGPGKMTFEDAAKAIARVDAMKAQAPVADTLLASAGEGGAKAPPPGEPPAKGPAAPTTPPPKKGAVEYPFKYFGKANYNPKTGEFDHMNSSFARKMKTYTEERARRLDQDNFERQGHEKNIILQTNKEMERMAGLADLDTYKSIYDKHEANEPMTAKEKALYDTEVKPKLDEADEIFQRLKKIDPDRFGPDVEFYMTHIPKNLPEKGVLADLDDPFLDPVAGFNPSTKKTPVEYERTYRMLEPVGGGDHQLISTEPSGGYKIWKANKPTVVDDPNFEFKAGEKYTDPAGQEWTMREAPAALIEKAAPIRYYRNANLAANAALAYMKQTESNMTFFKALKQHPDFLEHGVPPGTSKGAMLQARGKGYVPTLNKDFAGWLMDPHMAHVLDDMAQAGINSAPLNYARRISQAVTRTIFWWPAAHIMNVGAHWFVGRGWDWLPMSGGYRQLLSTGQQAMYHVLNDTPEMQRWRENGMSDLFASTKVGSGEDRFNNMVRAAGESIMRNKSQWDPLARVLGIGVKDLANKVYDTSRYTMWAADSMFKVQSILENINKGMTEAEAITHTQKIIPDYRMQAEILSSGPKGRYLQQFLREPTFFAFMPYHEGVANALTNMFKAAIKNTTPRAGESVEQTATRAKKEQVDAVGHMVALAVLAYGIYPVLDKMVQAATGNRGAEVNKRGPVALMSSAQDIARGKTDISDIGRRTLTLSPITTTATQLLSGRNFTGKPIVNQGDVRAAARGDIKAGGRAAVQGADFLGSNLFAPWGQVNRAAMKSGTPAQRIGHGAADALLDIKEPSAQANRYDARLQGTLNRQSNQRFKRPPSVAERLYNNTFGR